MYIIGVGCIFFTFNDILMKFKAYSEYLYSHNVQLDITYL